MEHCVGETRTSPAQSRWQNAQATTNDVEDDKPREEMSNEEYVEDHRPREEMSNEENGDEEFHKHLSDSQSHAALRTTNTEPDHSREEENTRYPNTSQGAVKLEEDHEDSHEDNHGSHDSHNHGTDQEDAQETEGSDQNSDHDQETHEDENEDDAAAATSLAEYDWQNLQLMFDKEMERKEQDEQQIHEDLNRLMNFYAIWSEIPAVDEHERAVKRLRTRIAYVQHEELQLKQKRAKHDQVVQAFKAALAMLSGL